MRKADDLQLAKHNTILPLLLQSNKRHDEMITKVSGELLDKLREEVWKVVPNTFANDRPGPSCSKGR